MSSLPLVQKDAKTRGLVAIITYEGLRRYKKSLVLVEWTAVCLDEGQKIRNPNADVTAVCKVCTPTCDVTGVIDVRMYESDVM